MTCPPGPNGLSKLLRRPLHLADHRCPPPEDRVSAAEATHPQGSYAQERTEDHRESQGIPRSLSCFTVCKGSLPCPSGHAMGWCWVPLPQCVQRNTSQQQIVCPQTHRRLCSRMRQRNLPLEKLTVRQNAKRRSFVERTSRQLRPHQQRELGISSAGKADLQKTNHPKGPPRHLFWGTYEHFRTLVISTAPESRRIGRMYRCNTPAVAMPSPERGRENRAGIILPFSFPFSMPARKHEVSTLDSPRSPVPLRPLPIVHCTTF